MITTTEIKKLLYKQNPEAKLRYIRKGIVYYDCEVYVEGWERRDEHFYAGPSPCKTEIISFAIPIDDMGDADFYIDMEAKLLIRWIINLKLSKA